MTGRPGMGLVIALVVEASHWTRLRWDFDDAAASKAWKISALGLVLATVLIWLDGNRIDAVPQLLTWLPPLLLPVQFVQSYGLRNSIPLNTFSFFTKQRRERNRKLGLQESVIHFNFGNFYFACCILAATLGKQADSWIYLPGLVVLSGWMLARYTRGSRLALLVALLIAGLLTLGGQWTLRTLHDRLTGRGGGSGSGFDPNYSHTAIGNLAEVKQSPDIVWRLKTPPTGAAPTLLRTASYNAYLATAWKRIVPPVAGVTANDFQDLDTVERDGETYHLLRAEAGAESLRADLPRFQIRGVATARTPLPLPGSAASLTGFDLEGVERNSLGTVRIFPAKSIIDGSVLWQDSANFEIPPLQLGVTSAAGTLTRRTDDLTVPLRERPVVEGIVEELGLARAATTREKLLILQRWYNAEFEYTKYLSIPRNTTERLPTEIGAFLTTHRSGHCEYFATSAVLLLRAAKVPARYAVGFSVMEKDQQRDEWNLRGIHAHSWCRVWDDSTSLWIDFDPTPANWLAMETNRQGSMQWLKDSFQRIREDFFLWRNDPRNRLGAWIVISLVAAAVFSFVAHRLWRSRRHVHARPGPSSEPGPSIRTPLHRLEPLVRKRIGPRPRGQTLAHWFAGLNSRLADPSPLAEAIALHQQLRFDPAPPPGSGLERLDHLSRQLESALKQLPAAKN